MSNEYAMLYELKAELDMAETLKDHDAALSLLLDTAADQIDSYCRRPDGFVALATGVARLFVGSGLRWLRADECISASLVEVKDALTDTAYVTWTVDTDYLTARGDPVNPDYNGSPKTLLIVSPNSGYAVFTSGRTGGVRGFVSDAPGQVAVPTVRVTAKWGYAVTCPSPIKTATIAQAIRWWKRLQGAMADAVASMEMGGTLLYRQGLDADIRFILEGGGYVKPLHR